MVGVGHGAGELVELGAADGTERVGRRVGIRGAAGVRGVAGRRLECGKPRG